jgi:hypothetical protein
MLRFFTGPARLIEIAAGCASPQALHTAKTSYLGMMVPRRDTLPALPLCFSRSKMSRSIQTIGPSHDHQPTAWQVRARVAPLAQMFRRRQCPLCMAIFDGDVLSLYVAKLAQPAELPRHGRTHELDRTSIDTLSGGLSSAAAPPRDVQKRELNQPVKQ